MLFVTHPERTWILQLICASRIYRFIYTQHAHIFLLFCFRTVAIVLWNVNKSRFFFWNSFAAEPTSLPLFFHLHSPHIEYVFTLNVYQKLRCVRKKTNVCTEYDVSGPYNPVEKKTSMYCTNVYRTTTAHTHHASQNAMKMQSEANKQYMSERVFVFMQKIDVVHGFCALSFYILHMQMI